jgi:hypothetical protein
MHALHHAYTFSIFSLDRDRWLAKSSADVGVLTAKVSWRGIVADGKKWSSPPGFLKSAAFDSRTSNFFGTSPCDLREMAPSLEVAHVRVILAVEAFVERSFVVVHSVGDHGRDILRRCAGANVLSISLSIVVLVLVGLAVEG